MGTVKADLIKTDLIETDDIRTEGNTIPTVNGQRLIPTAWVNFNGTGVVTIRDSEGVDSVTDNGTGDYTVNFTAPMDNDDYIVIVKAQLGATNLNNGGECGPRTTLAFDVRTASKTTNGALDYDTIFAVAFGGKD